MFKGYPRLILIAAILTICVLLESAASPNSVNFTPPATMPFYSHGVDLTSVLQSPPYFEYDFEQGINANILTGAIIPFNQGALPWRFAQIQNPLGIQILENPETGNHYAKAFWQKGGGTEYDLNTQRKIQIYGEFGAHARQEEVWTFESFFPKVGFEYDNYPEIIVQLHGRPDECEFDRDPPMALEIKQDNIIVTWRNDERECTPFNFTEWNTRVRNLGPLPKGQRLTWIIHVAWSPNGEGYLTIILNNKVLIMEDNLFIGYEDEVSPYIGWGIYKFTLQSNHESRTAYYDNFKQWVLR